MTSADRAWTRINADAHAGMLSPTTHPHWELTERIIGCVFQTFNVLKFGHPERYYQRALAESFRMEGLTCRREVYVPIRFGTRIVGRYFFDFLVEEKVIVELKIAPEVYQRHVQQLLSYLRGTPYEVGLLCLLQRDRVEVKRFVCSKEAATPSHPRDPRRNDPR